MFSITDILSLFVLLIIASLAFFAAKRFKMPYTVLLVLIGIVIVPLVSLPFVNPYIGFLGDLQLTPEMLFYIFLPVLIFESAFNMNIRNMVESAWSIFSLSVVSLIISTLIVASALYFLLPLLGLSIPFIVALLFGSIISATDPVAVLALFKEFGAPKRLTLIFEGESLFNDGTAVALFLVVLGVAQSGFNGFGTVFEGFGVFVMMVALGVVLGLAMAMLISRVLHFTRSNEFVSITLLIVSAHLVFILAELINETPIFGLHLHVSSIIATTVSSLFLGNYARHILSPKSDEYLNKSIEHLAFVANSLVFIMAGMLFASIDIDWSVMIWPIALTVLVVAIARAISIFAVTNSLNLLKLEASIPKTWRYLLAWGSLRGALAIIVVLLIPDDLTISGWSYEFSIKELVIALTIGCILATLFIKATTIGKMINKLHINELTPFQRAYRLDLGIYYLLVEKARIDKYIKRGFMDKESYENVSQLLMGRINSTKEERVTLLYDYGQKLFEQTLRYIAIDIEMKYLKELYKNLEVNEVVYRRVKGKLNLQKERIEHGKFDEVNSSMFTDRKDVFDRLVLFMQSPFSHGPKSLTVQERYQYYRAQSIIARKVVKVIEQMQNQCDGKVFDEKSYEVVRAIYSEYHNRNEAMLADIVAKHHDKLIDFTNEMSQHSLHASGEKALAFLSSRGLATEAAIEEIEHAYSICK